MNNYTIILNYNHNGYVNIENYYTDNSIHNKLIDETKLKILDILNEITKQYQNEIGNYIPTIEIIVEYCGDDELFSINKCDIWINDYMINDIDIDNWIDIIDKSIEEISFEI